MNRLHVSMSVALSIAAVAPSVWADEGDACVSSYENAQESRRQGELVRSDAELRLCVNACPDALARDCRSWLDDVAKSLAHVRITVVSNDRKRLDHLRVSLDGLELSSAVSLADVKMNPGAHKLRVEADGMKPDERAFQVTAGARIGIGVGLARAPTPIAPAEKPRPLPVYPIVLGSIGLAGVAAGGILGIVGQVDVADMRSDDGCAPGCPKSRVDRVRTEYAVGGVMAGVGAGLVVTSIVLFVTESNRPPAKSAILPAIGVDPFTRSGQARWTVAF